ncbi:MAG TPA: 16S rRNA (cytosine(967)-C(5))-methyltransferase RsmB [Feifaniaceae bacterium]|nr:16S rRNA (cytosine(967)-C(5))-methyltransferase RsmB [Feifaniaceae bacterium]
MSVRRAALEALMDITDRGAYANLRLKEAQRNVSASDAKWVFAAVYETLDHLLYLDYALASVTTGTQKPVIRGILRMGACQLLFMRVPPSAAVNESVKLAKEVGKGAMAGYINGVLRALARGMDALPPLPEEPAARLSIKYSWPKWLVTEWISRFGEAETELMLREQPQPMALRAQPPFTAEALERALKDRGVGFSRGLLDPNCFKLERGFDVSNDPLFQDGSVAVQSESAMLVCRACGVKPNMRVLDACAAPGGKSAYLYALEPELSLTAWELHPHRKELMDKTFARLRVPVQANVQDAAEPVEECREAFDAVLLDVPCSGLGVAHNKPDVRYAKTPEAIGALATAQRRILEACAAYVKPGGALVYASCTISERENEEQVNAFLARHKEFRLDSLTPFLPAALGDLTSGMVQLLPHRHHTEGFFIARLVRLQGEA